jgi:catechol 2,3-dioxygenase-like lactoylglutathione lyase family enzyme
MKRRLMAAMLAAATVQPALAEVAPPPGKAAEAPSVAIMGTGLHSSDLDATIKFYTEGLGFSLISRFPMGEIEEAMLAPQPKSPGPYIMLAQRKSGGEAEPAEVLRRSDRIVLRVTDAEALHARLEAAGYQPGDIRDVGGQDVKVFWASDPDGHHLEIVQLSPENLKMMGGG